MYTPPPRYGWLRLAHMSPDSMGVAFCVTGSDGATWSSGYDPGGGIIYPGVGHYVQFEADLYQIKIIGAGQDCTGATIGTISDFSLAVDTYHTVIIDGVQANRTLGVRTHRDFNTPATGNASINVCHEDSGAPSVRLGMLDAAEMFIPLLGTSGMPILFAYGYCASAEIPAPLVMGTVLAISTDGVTIDGRWTWPTELPPGSSASFFIYGTDTTDIGLYACINPANTCLPLPTAI